METTRAQSEFNTTKMISSKPAEGLNETQLTDIFNIIGFSERISLVATNFVIEILIFTLNVLVLLAVKSLTRCGARHRASRGDVPVPVSRSEAITYYFIKQLVCSDLITGLIAVPVQMVDIILQVPRTRALCVSLKFLRIFSATASYYLLATINFERWWAISFPFRSFSLHRVRWFVRASWIYVLLQATPIVFLATTKTEKLNNTHSIQSCTLLQSGKRSRIIAQVYLGVMFTFPFFTSAVFTVLILRRIKSGATAAPITEAARAAANFSVNVTATLFLSCVPILVYAVVTLITGQPSAMADIFAFTVFGVLRNMNAAINPILTVYSFGKIRGKVKQYLRLTSRGSFGPALSRYIAETGNVELVAVVRTPSIRKTRSGPLT